MLKIPCNMLPFERTLKRCTLFWTTSGCMSALRSLSDATALLKALWRFTAPSKRSSTISIPYTKPRKKNVKTKFVVKVMQLQH